MIPSLRQSLPELYNLLDTYNDSNISDIIAGYCTPCLSKNKPASYYDLGVFGLEEATSTIDGLCGLAAGNHIDILISHDNKKGISADDCNTMVKFALSNGAADVYKYFANGKINDSMAEHDSFHDILLENDIINVAENMFPNMCANGAISNMRRLFDVNKISVVNIKQGLINALKNRNDNVVDFICERFTHGSKRSNDEKSLEAVLRKHDLLYLFVAHATVNTLRKYMKKCNLYKLSDVIANLSTQNIFYIYKNSTSRFKQIYSLITCHRELSEYINILDNVNYALVQFLHRDSRMNNVIWSNIARKIIISKGYIGSTSLWALHNCTITNELSVIVIEKCVIEYTIELIKVTGITINDCLDLCENHPGRSLIIKYYSNYT